MPDPDLIVTGPPGAGKTTTARLLAARSKRAVHLESDSFFHFIRAGYIEPWRRESHEQNTTVMRIVATAAAGYSDAGYVTIVDGIISPRWFFEPLRDALYATGHTVAYAVLRAPLAVCKSRAANREAGPLTDRAFRSPTSNGVVASATRSGRRCQPVDAKGEDSQWYLPDDQSIGFRLRGVR